MPMREVPYPWRQLTIDAAKELIQELEGVAQDEKDKVAAGIEDIIDETPKTQLAATRLQKILNQAKEASSPIVQALRTWSVDFASETAKKIITGL